MESLAVEPLTVTSCHQPTYHWRAFSRTHDCAKHGAVVCAVPAGCKPRVPRGATPGNPAAAGQTNAPTPVPCTGPCPTPAPPTPASSSSGAGLGVGLGLGLPAAAAVAFFGVKRHRQLGGVGGARAFFGMNQSGSQPGNVQMAQGATDPNSAL